MSFVSCFYFLISIKNLKRLFHMNILCLWRVLRNYTIVTSHVFCETISTFWSALVQWFWFWFFLFWFFVRYNHINDEKWFRKTRYKNGTIVASYSSETKYVIYENWKEKQEEHRRALTYSKRCPVEQRLWNLSKVYYQNNT